MGAAPAQTARPLRNIVAAMRSLGVTGAQRAAADLRDGARRCEEEYRQPLLLLSGDGSTTPDNVTMPWKPGWAPNWSPLTFDVKVVVVSVEKLRSGCTAIGDIHGSVRVLAVRTDLWLQRDPPVLVFVRSSEPIDSSNKPSQAAGFLLFESHVDAMLTLLSSR
uniref:Uncharacterized protein n=1 Tax=mine drainage metagenome TaxID=410659 RepID=E6PP10_9ZZZZ